ncbi:MAG: hypothetical protein R2860_07245 [Desulfobacterales bacterium]
MSCLILTSHVKNGIELAKEKKLGQHIIDAIHQHHGTTLISFFFNKAKQQAKEGQVVNVDNFRYPSQTPDPGNRPDYAGRRGGGGITDP